MSDIELQVMTDEQIHEAVTLGLLELMPAKKGMADGRQ